MSNQTPKNPFFNIYQNISNLEQSIAETANSIKSETAKLALDNAQTILSDVVAEYVRTAEKHSS